MAILKFMLQTTSVLELEFVYKILRLLPEICQHFSSTRHNYLFNETLVAGH